MNVILLGPPGAGKGTQAQLIVKNHNYFQLSTGDLLRSEIKKKTKIGVEIENLISKGNFVSDEIVEDLIKSTIDNLKFRDRIIFDGYPRNVIQAKNPIRLNSTPASLNHADVVVIRSIYGNPEPKPNESITNIFLKLYIA